MSYRAMNWFLGALLGLIVTALVASCGAATRGPDLNAPAAKTALERTVKLVAVCSDDGKALMGSGVVAQAETVVTARHVGKNPDCTGPVYVFDATGKPVNKAEFVVEVPGADVVIMSAPGYGQGKESVCFRPPVEGEHVITVGYPGGELKVTEGAVGKTNGPYQRDFSARIDQGASGGGVWADDECLVGIVSAYHMNDHTGIMVPVASDGAQ